MTAALDASQRTTLERLVTRARRLLENDLLERASGRYGIDPDGTIADEDALRLDATALVQRRELVDVVHHLRSEGEDAPGAVSRLLREATFTHLNRLVAIRIAEALSLLPPSLADGRTSQGFRDVLELVPALADDDTGGYWTYLSFCGDELAGDVPALFDPRNPLLALAPSPSALDDVVELIAAPDAADLWLAPDCLGWVYQFFNTGEERRAMREGSAAPRDSRELAVRNQFFTPRYVVDFLVQNSLGRRLIDADPTTPLLGELPLLIDPPTEAGEPLELSDASMLDPACGSGHFLLAGYDVLERAWHHAGVDAATAARAIVQSLWGIDIDPRCAQVAAAAIIFRARRSCPEGDLPRPNIICARALPATATGLDDVLAALPARARQLVEAMSDAMSDAPILGSLLKIEERLSTAVRAAAFGGASRPDSLAGELPADSLQVLEVELLDGLAHVADMATASPAERLLAAEADDAIRFVHALQRRYDAVCMNPPFGEPVAATKGYLKAAYPWIPTKDYNLLAAFVGRGLELCRDAGYLGAITARSGFFLKTFERWRREVVLHDRLVALADLGFGVMEQAMVEAAAYVLTRGRPEESSQTTFVRLLRDVDRARALAEAAVSTQGQHRGQVDDRVFRLSSEVFSSMPGAPLAYWLDESLRGLFDNHPSMESSDSRIAVGLSSGDDFRFVRALWEVSPERVARSAAETKAGKRWAPFAKGGEYAPYWSDIHLVVDYGHEGETIRTHPGAAVRNADAYFQRGVTWPRRTNSAMSVRVLPAGCVLGDKGPAVISAEPLLDLAWLNSRLVRLLIDSTAASADETQTGGVPSRSYEIGIVKGLPSPTALIADQAAVSGLAADLARFAATLESDDETSPRFVAPWALAEQGTFEERVHAAESRRRKLVRLAVQNYAAIDELLTSSVAPTPGVLRALDEAAGPLTESYSGGPLDESERETAVRLLGLPMSGLIDAATATIGMSRFVRLQHQIIDRRLELAALALKRPVASILDVAEERRVLPPDSLENAAASVVSYLVGCAFGRWDIRTAHVGQEVDVDELFEQVPVAARGMLVGENGLPSRESPPGYPVAVAALGLLVDEPGHAQDLLHQIAACAAVVVDDPDQFIVDVVSALGVPSIRDYLRRRLFRDHLSRYSKSRRKAPIYWPLYLPSGRWGTWLYAPKLTRETLFAIAAVAGTRLDHAEAEIRRLTRERDAGGAGRSDRAVANALDSEESLAEELRRFRDEGERIAGLGWEPDLDDGIILCAAPLADLFPAWKDAATARKDLKAGKYDWSTVAKWADRL